LKQHRYYVELYVIQRQTQENDSWQCNFFQNFLVRVRPVMLFYDEMSV